MGNKCGRPSKGAREEFTIRVPIATAARVREMAAETGSSINDIVVWLIERYTNP